MKQKTLRVFEVDDFDKLKNIISSKLPLIKNHFFMLKEKNEKIEALLKEYNLNYFILNGEGFTFCKEKKEEKIKVIEKEKLIIQPSKSEIYDKIIRSGVEIESDKNLVFLKRINEGAKIISSGNIEIFDENAGLVICNGDYMIIRKNRGIVIFNGEEIGEIDKLTFISEKIKKVLE